MLFRPLDKAGNPLLREALAACRGGFYAAAVFSLFINLLMLTAPLFMLQVFDRVLSSRSSETLMLLLVIAGGALLAMSALEAIRGWVLVRISSWLDRTISGPILTGSISATLRKGTSPSIQGLRDLATFRNFLSGPSIFPIMDAPWTPIFLAVMFLLHPLLGWMSVIGALVLFSLAIANEIATRKLLLLSGGASIRALHQAEASVRNADVIEAMGMISNLIDRWHSQNAEALDFQAKASIRSGAITAFSKFVRLILQIGLLSVGAWLVIQNEITPGAMIAGAILMARALAPVEQAIGSWKSMMAARNAYARVKQQISEMPQREPAMPLPTPSGKIQVEGVSFAHPNYPKPTIRGVTFQLAPGEALGMVGPTAAGKTTLARLLTGSLKPQLGNVRLDGMDVAEWDAGDRGRHIGYLPQDVELFSGTVRENIARMGEGDTEAVIEAAKIADVHEMILRMPRGYETEIGEGGAALSGGQRQRIALARAVYGDPKFIVLDEPNASLDNEGEAALLKALGIFKDREVTVVVIAHRPSILRHVDKVLILRDGTLQTFGARDEVVTGLMGPKSDQDLALEGA